MKPQATTQPTAAYLAKLDRALRDTSAAEEEYRFVGCTASESAFSGDKVYAGGPTGASFTLAKQPTRRATGRSTSPWRATATTDTCSRSTSW